MSTEMSEITRSSWAAHLQFSRHKTAVQASLSLKNWVNLWTLLPHLHFDYSLFKKLSSFDKFVDNVLRLRDDSVKINKFNFSRRRMTKSTPRVVSYAVSHHVQHLTFSFELPTCMNDLVSPNSPRSLKQVNLELDHRLCLEQLVTLHLENLTLNALENFSGCPNLQDLTLKHNCFYLRSLRIVAPQLLRLTISNRHFPAIEELVLSTPRLTFFKFKNQVLPLLQTDDLKFLDKVDMDMGFVYSFGDEERLRLVSMLKCFNKASSIRLSCI